MIERLSDEEIICTWMEPKPTRGPFDFRPWERLSPRGWWEAVGRNGAWLPSRMPNEWKPRELRLNALWQVGEALTEELRGTYYRIIHTPDERDEQGRRVASRSNWEILQATPARRIKALVAVLRPIVEAKKAPVLGGVFDHQPECCAPDYQECTCKPAAERTQERP